MPIESVEHAQGEFLRLGADIEVLAPGELRARIGRTVAELAERYGNVAGNGGD
ncbi:WYL domain-containing protein [Streptomyces adelaidensis]|uniref:WYL domain-containing protein n=1 Tax=Streptomyces adelaidensis TaxID=2796465 RepID=UPI0027DC2086|nr:WYL domain-containing protein [Streptomyces adelaidensis]